MAETLAPAEPFDAESPWTALKGVSSVRVAPHRGPLTGAITVPGSKSVSNRALILAAMAEGETRLSGLLRSDDIFWCGWSLQQLGAGISFDGTEAQVTGIGRKRPDAARLHVGSAGTVARFLPPFLLAGDQGRFEVTASAQMSKRPVGPLFDALKAGGGEIDFLGAPNCYPAVFHGGSFRGGEISISGNVSSQFISGILLGAAQSESGLKLNVTGGIVQSDYVRITLDTMAHFGVGVAFDDEMTRFEVAPQTYRGKDLVVEADASTATYFSALAVATGGDIVLSNIGEYTRQPDYAFHAILELMGANVTRGATSTRVQMSGPIRGGFEMDMRPLSDASLTLAALAPFADAPITITNVAHIRHHESDRIAAMCQSLTKVGITVEEREDGMTIFPGKPRFAVLDTFEDHRMAMALAVLGVAGDGVELKEPGCVSKTCPTFFDELGKLGISTDMLV
ncbi:MAG: 3-phosphoshikimate 1-carboxyvinyltransferase [Hyphomicrobiaceae bacterium]|nr:3-phosphoshikimate 1-carboxyvinyltransferase [Hyphomicrobiaceae bacterium]MCC0024191.1 3-phosphoshikimate 1-carboxyvinyltransferase [Hyphomicrobiaceae bacterium]